MIQVVVLGQESRERWMRYRCGEWPSRPPQAGERWVERRGLDSHLQTHVPPLPALVAAVPLTSEKSLETASAVISLSPLVHRSKNKQSINVFLSNYMFLLGKKLTQVGSGHYSNV